ncbi:MAG: T9SS type A sorting domain-containing protein [Saprospiraceae bacterium]|nr:T9SS type A sorting domain-containing protein [Bacteroidia bacterium]NNL91755.1 T9SS type A sorting domain-containing protein [Saprospiraceae bacterium]
MKYFYSTVVGWLRSCVCVLLTLTFVVNDIYSQDPPCSLACNGSTQVSIDVNCEADITAEMILNDQVTSCSAGNFEVTVSNQYGQIPNPIVDPSYIGQDLYAKVTDLNSGNSCWGNIILEDKLGPLLEECPTDPVDIKCSDFSILDGPVYMDACEGFAEPILVSESIDPICDPDYIKTITRTYSAVDSKGNRAPNCTIIYQLLRIDFDDVSCPPSYSKDNNNALSCDGTWSNNQLCDKSELFTVLDTDTDGDGVFDVDLRWDDNNNGYPDPEEVGSPTITTIINGELEEVSLYPFPDVYCNATMLYTDVELPKVGCSRKIMRTWTLREWHCDGEQMYTCPDPQILEILDFTPPEISCPEPLQITTNTIMGATSTSYGSVTCGSSVGIPLPEASDNCSTNLRFDVNYEGGFEGNYDGFSPIVLPMGVNSVEYAVYDECYNSSTCIVQVEIVDNTPPVAICDQYTAVSLTTGGEAVVKAHTFDDGSYDDCKTHCMLVRRMTPDQDNCDCKVPEFCGLNYVGENNGSYYYISTYNSSANIAKKRAAAYGGSLAIFENQVEEDWLVSKVRQNYGDRFWIGMKRFGNSFLWDNHDPLTYENWTPGRPASSETRVDLTVHSTVGNSVLVSDGAFVNNVDDMVSNLTVSQGPAPSIVDISWNWLAPRTGSFTVDDGINMKLLYYNGYKWESIYTERYTGVNTTNTIEPFLDITQSGSFRFSIPANAACGTNYFRIAIEDNAFASDIILGDYGNGDCSSHYDNADVAFEVLSGECAGDCVLMSSDNYWYDAPCLEEVPYILEIKDICGFSTKVNFCCSDVGTDQMVVFRVIDIFGNYNDCMVNIDVQDKVAPSLICPPNTTVDCDAAFNPSNLTPQFGYPTLLDDCGADVEEDGINELTSCNLGTFTRVFTATDEGGRSSTCKQIITFENPDPFTGTNDIVCPRDSVLVGCMIMADLTPEQLGEPQFMTERCGLLGTNSHDEIFTFNSTNGDACFKVLRTWEIIDWCQSSLPIASCVQTIKVTNDIKPTVSAGDSVEVCTYDNDCAFGYIELSSSGSDDCTDSLDLRWRYSIYTGELGVGPKSYSTPYQEYSGDGNKTGFSGDFPIGTHVVRWTYFDRCGNATSKDQVFTIYNCKAPTAYCLSGIAVDLMPMDFNGDGEPDFGMVELWASDFNAGSSHPCGYDVFLSFSPDTSDRFIQFDCTSRGDTLVEIWASVVGYNGTLVQSFCTSLVNVQDNNFACQGQMEETVDVGGSIFTETLESVGEVNVNLDGSPLSEMTNEFGEYAFPEMPMGGEYIINPSNNLNPLNGVTTLDLVQIQRHILGLDKLDSPYKIIAADVNKDNNLSTIDLLELRKLILGIYDELPNNDSWRYVDNAYKFVDPQNPLDENFTEDYYINKLESDMNIDFIAVKIGDVNSSATTSYTSGVIDQRSRSISLIKIEDQNFEAGELIQVPVNFDETFSNGFQFTLDYNSSLIDIESLEGTDGSFTNANYKVKGNNVVVSYHSQTGTPVDGDVFVINAVAKTSGSLSEAINISSELIASELYQVNGEIKQPKLDFGSKVSDNKFELFQNSPNPFTDLTTVSFNLEKDEKVSISVTDVQGKLVKQFTQTYLKGLNTITVRSEDLNNSGIFYMTLKTDNNIATVKMVAIK